MDASNILKALGGKENLEHLDSCITRLRITLKDQSKMNEHTLKSEGVIAVMKLGNGNVQLIIGTDAEFVEQDIKDLL